uniref:Uncharacterized protein n=1 Tax=Rhipicephalus microplus TaxID=6941 RepID=A0A6G5AIN7_RHIMP
MALDVTPRTRIIRRPLPMSTVAFSFLGQSSSGGVVSLGITSMSISMSSILECSGLLLIEHAALLLPLPSSKAVRIFSCSLTLSRLSSMASFSNVLFLFWSCSIFLLFLSISCSSLCSLFLSSLTRLPLSS